MSGPQWAVGVHAVTELIRRNPAQISEVLVQADRQDRRLSELRQLASKSGLRLREVSRAELDALGDTRHQGVAAAMQAGAGQPARQESDLESLLADSTTPPLILVLDGITDPHNLGACLRTADAAGVTAVLIPKDKAVGLTPAVRKVASGAAETVPLLQVTNLARSLKTLQEQGIWIVGTDDEADTEVFDQDLTGPLAIVMGSEGSGLRRLTRECCDFLVSIPMAGALSSLNVSVATGVTLFEAVRQRRA
jgi:23S rRNA (guanosine2251-2'-O)-methyltransferase